MKLKGHSAIGAILLAMVSIILILGLSGITSAGALTIGRMPDPTDTLKAYMDSIIECDFEKAAGYMYDCDDLGLSQQPEGEADKVLFNTVINNYAYEIKNIEVKGVNAFAEITFTCCDLNLMRDDLKEEVAKGIERGVWDGKDVESADFLLGVVADSAELVTEDITPYLADSEQTIELVYYESEWRVLFSNELYNAMLGRP